MDITGYTHKNGFCCIFPFYEIFMVKLMNFSCDIEYRRVEFHVKEAAILFLRNGLPTKGVQTYFQSGPLSQILAIADPRAKLKPLQNLSSGFDEGNYAVVINESMMYEYFSSLPQDWLCCVFPWNEKLIAKPMHFPCDKDRSLMEESDP